MRQDMRERQKQIRRLHESIEKYTQSPKTKKAVEQAAIQLQNAIQYKFRKSQINANYSFPRLETVSDDQFDSCPEICNLNNQIQFISHELSIADEPQSNPVYISQKTILSQERHSPFSKHNPQGKSKLKIKVFKKQNTQQNQTFSKIARLKTQHLKANNSILNHKRQTISTKVNQNDSSFSKSKLIPPTPDTNKIKTKLKISAKIQNQLSYSPFSANITMKTQYTHCTKRKQGKQNMRIPLSNQYLVNLYSKHYISHNSTKKIQINTIKPYLNSRGAMKKKKEQEISQSISQLHLNKNQKATYKSFQKLKSIRLGYGSNQKVKIAKGLHA